MNIQSCNHCNLSCFMHDVMDMASDLSTWLCWLPPAMAENWILCLRRGRKNSSDQCYVSLEDKLLHLVRVMQKKKKMKLQCALLLTRAITYIGSQCLLPFHGDGRMGNYLLWFALLSSRRGGSPAGWLPSHTPQACSTHLFLCFSSSESRTKAVVLQKACTAVNDCVCQHPREDYSVLHAFMLSEFLSFCHMHSHYICFFTHLIVFPLYYLCPFLSPLVSINGVMESSQAAKLWYWSVDRRTS